MENSTTFVFLSPADPRRVRSWSGTLHFMLSAISRPDTNVQVVTGGIVEFAARLLNKLISLTGRKYDIRFCTLYARLVGAIITARLRHRNNRFIIAAAASNYVAFLRTEQPIIYVSDSTFYSNMTWLSDFQDFPPWLRRQGDLLEQRSLQRAARVVYPSEWAKDQAIEYYGVSDTAIEVLPFGPNIPTTLIKRFARSKQVEIKTNINILYVGMDWQRKGGALVLEIGSKLRARSLRCRIFLVGRIPKHIVTDEGVSVIGFLDKNRPEHLARLCELYAEAHFFVLPTEFDPFGVVFSEAQAFGCPSLTYASGGTATAVLDGETGYAMPTGATADDFAEKIAQLVRDPARYETMSRDCRQRFRQSASWDAWAESVLRIAQAASVAE